MEPIQDDEENERENKCEKETNIDYTLLKMKRKQFNEETNLCAGMQPKVKWESCLRLSLPRRHHRRCLLLLSIIGSQQKTSGG